MNLFRDIDNAFTNILAVLCILVVIGIICFVVYGIWMCANESSEKHRKQVDTAKNDFNENKEKFAEVIFNFFNCTHISYQDTYSVLESLIPKMEAANEKLKNLSENDDYSDYSEAISGYSELADEFNAFGQRVNRLPYTRMMDSVHYGKIQQAYLDSVRSMNKSTADTIIANCEGSIASHRYDQIFAIDIEAVLRCVWFYATDKPYSAESFKKAVNVFNLLVEKPHVDVTIAELYAMKQMGGEDVLRDHIRNMLKSTRTAEELTLIASALMWMNAYQAENMILQHMLSTGIQMSEKTQERLHSLTNGGGKAPNGFNVASNDSTLYFDVSALAWKDDEYNGLFENLAFQEKALSYSLAVRDEDKDLLITNRISMPGTDKIFAKLSSVFAEEYGAVVTAKLKKCVVLSGSGEENMEGILVESNECKHMGILVYVEQIGKKLNIKFYILFMPRGTRLADQKQQVLSLYKKLSPSVAMWESSMKDTVLMAIQQLLNEEPTTFNGGNTSDNSEVPIF